MMTYYTTGRNFSAIFILALSIIASNQKQNQKQQQQQQQQNQLDVPQQIKKMLCIYIVKYYVAVKIIDVLKVAYKWVDLENITPR